MCSGGAIFLQSVFARLRLVLHFFGMHKKQKAAGEGVDN